ncbi:MAG: Tfp pilus assembly protein FimT/FimU [Planctomycetaceae bacterium]
MITTIQRWGTLAAATRTSARSREVIAACRVPRLLIRSAFTLIEVLLVIFLLSILFIVLLVEIGPMQRAEDLPESSRRIKAMIAMCRAEAMSNAQRYRLRFFRDGTIDLTHQLDPLIAPHLFSRVKKDWATIPLLIGDTWVESILPLPDGPPPILVEDDELDLEQFDEDEPVVITTLEQPFEMWFEPDGTSTSARWTLREVSGRGLQMMLDGRVGRVTIESTPRIETETIERPEAILPEERTLNIVENPKETLEELRAEYGT